MTRKTCLAHSLPSFASLWVMTMGPMWTSARICWHGMAHNEQHNKRRSIRKVGRAKDMPPLSSNTQPLVRRILRALLVRLLLPTRLRRFGGNTATIGIQRTTFGHPQGCRIPITAVFVLYQALLLLSFPSTLAAV